jgi:hypothetical protein
VAAGFVLLALAGLGASEAAGLSQVADLVATILRIKTPEGTLMVKVDDPGVKVDVDDEVVIIGGAGPQEIRLRTGLHRVLATRNGQPVRDELVSIMRGKKEIVAIGFEPMGTASVDSKSAAGLSTEPSAGMNNLFPIGGAHPARTRAMVWSLAYSPDGRLAIGQQGIDGLASVLRVWDLAGKSDVICMTRPRLSLRRLLAGWKETGSRDFRLCRGDLPDRG